MLLWLLEFIGCILCNILCYLTNPIAVLFADEVGECPKTGFWSFLQLWWTDDNDSLDISWMIDEEIVWKIFRYDYHKHYFYHYEDKSTGVTIPGYVDLLDGNFTFKEKVQRYFCRLAWLYRNNAYGFAAKYFSCEYKVADMKYAKVIEETNKDGFDNELRIGYLDDGKKLWLDGKWVIRGQWAWCSKFYWRYFMGWKLNSSASDPQETYIANLAVYLPWPFRKI